MWPYYMYSCGDGSGQRAVIKDSVPRQEEASFCHRMEQSPEQVRKIGLREGEEGRAGERENTFTTIAFSLEEPKLVWPRETNPFFARCSSVVRVCPSLSLVNTLRNYSRVARDETRGIIRSAHIASLASKFLSALTKPRPRPASGHA